MLQKLISLLESIVVEIRTLVAICSNIYMLIKDHYDTIVVQQQQNVHQHNEVEIADSINEITASNIMPGRVTTPDIIDPSFELDEEAIDDPTSPYSKLQSTLLGMTARLQAHDVDVSSRATDQSLLKYKEVNESVFRRYLDGVTGLPDLKNMSYLGDAYLFFILYNIDSTVVAKVGSNNFICNEFKDYPLGYGSLEKKADKFEAALGYLLVRNYFPLMLIKRLYPTSDRKLQELHHLFMNKILPYFRGGEYLSANIKMKSRARTGFNMS
jgi:hypothetical protein